MPLRSSPRPLPGPGCDPAAITADTGDFVPGGEVTVQGTCTVRLSDLSLLHIPGTETITSTFTAPIDVYRGEALGFRNSERFLDREPKYRGVRYEATGVLGFAGWPS